MLFRSGGGLAELPADGATPPNMLLPGARYEQVMEAFGGKGWYCTDPSEIKPALDAAAAWGGPALVHITLDTKANRKPQEFAWKS